MPEIDPQDAAAFQQSPFYKGSDVGPSRPFIEVNRRPPEIDPRDAEAFASGQPSAAQPTAQSSLSAPQTSTAQRIAIDFQNQIAAGGQRTTPIISAQAPNLLGTAMVNDAGEVGYQDQNGRFQPTDQNRMVVLTDPNDNTPKVYSRTTVTNESTLPALGRLLGTGMGAGNLEGAITRTVPAGVAAAEQLGVNVPKAIAGGPLTQYAGQLVARLPGGSPLSERISQSIADLEAVTQRAGPEVAQGTANEASAGQGFREAIGNYFKPKAQEASALAYNRVSQLVNPNRTTPLEKTQAAVADIVARRQASGREDVGKAVNSVLGGATRPGGLTFNGIKDLRTSVGEMLDTSMFPEGMSQSELRQIYAGLSDDLKAAAAANGPRAAAAFEQANALHKQIQGWKDQIQKLLGSEQNSGENIYRAIVRAASDGTSDVHALTVARAAVPPQVWQNVAATAVSTLGRNRVGVWTPAAFLSDYRGLTDQGKRLLFGSVGRRDLIPLLDNLAETSKNFVQAGKLANTSGTASHNLAYGVVGGAIVGLAHGAFLEPISALAALVGNNMVARFLASPATAAATAKWARVYNSIVGNPTPALLATFDRASRELVATARSSGANIPADFSTPLKKRIEQPKQRAKQLPAH